jgi:hypothetical protein
MTWWLRFQPRAFSSHASTFWKSVKKPRWQILRYFSWDKKSAAVTQAQAESALYAEQTKIAKSAGWESVLFCKFNGHFRLKVISLLYSVRLHPGHFSPAALCKAPTHTHRAKWESQRDTMTMIHSGAFKGRPPFAQIATGLVIIITVNNAPPRAPFLFARAPLLYIRCVYSGAGPCRAMHFTLIKMPMDAGSSQS